MSGNRTSLAADDAEPLDQLDDLASFDGLNDLDKRRASLTRDLQKDFDRIDGIVDEDTNPVWAQEVAERVAALWMGRAGAVSFASAVVDARERAREPVLKAGQSPLRGCSTGVASVSGLGNPREAYKVR